MHRHREDSEGTELVIREQAVQDQPEPEHDRYDRSRGAVGELEDPRSGDKRHADDVVEESVNPRRNEAHETLPETYGYLIVGRGEAIELHFWESPEVDPFTTDHSCYIRVDDADALHAEWEAAGVQPDPATGSRLMPPGETDYGMRDFTLVDKSGNLVRVGSPP